MSAKTKINQIKLIFFFGTRRCAAASQATNYRCRGTMTGVASHSWSGWPQ